jgi:hypothetical protein
MESGFVIREVLDAATLRRATTCPARAIVIAHKPAAA